MDKSKLVIADPSLVDNRGHHFNLTALITHAALKAGYEVIWFVNLEFKSSFGVDNVKIIPVFSFTMYDRYRPENKGKNYEGLSSVFCAELMNAVSISKLQESDHIFFHTAFGDIFRGIPKLLVESSLGGAYIHFCTPYDMNTMPGGAPLASLDQVFKKIRLNKLVDKKVFFWAETKQLGSYYSALYGMNVRPLPLPPPVTYGSNVKNKKNKEGRLRVLYLGAAREEKGFLYLPKLVEYVSKDKYLRESVEFVIQCSPQIVGYIPSIKEAINQLSKYSKELVTLFDDVLDEDSYHMMMASADIVLLLYNKRTYQIRGSGIAIEAICSGKCLLTFSGTFCADLLTHNGGVAVDESSEAKYALEKMVRSWPLYSERAKKQAEEYHSVNSTDNYINRLFNVPAYTKALRLFPSMYVGKIEKQLL